MDDERLVVGMRRLRQWHRRAVKHGSAQSLREFARSLPDRAVDVGLAYVFVGKAAALRALTGARRAA